MKVVLSMSCVVLTLLSVGCSQKKSTAQLADELTGELQQLPSVLKEVKDEASGRVAAEQVRQLCDALIVIVQEVDRKESLTLEQRVIVEKKIRAVQEETEFLLQKLSGQPQAILALSEPLVELGEVLEAASTAMKGK